MNATDMVCRIHDGTPPVYVVTIEVSLPESVAPERLREQIGGVCRAMSLDFAMAEVRLADL